MLDVNELGLSHNAQVELRAVQIKASAASILSPLVCSNER